MTKGVKRMNELEFWEDWGDLLDITVAFWTWQDCCDPEFTAAMFSSTRSSQDQSSHHSGMKWEGIHDPQLLNMELWTVDGFWEKEKSISLKGVAPDRLPMF